MRRLFRHDSPNGSKVHLDGKTVSGRKVDSLIDVCDNWLTGFIQFHCPVSVAGFFYADGRFAETDFDNVDLLFTAIDGVNPRRQDIGLNSLALILGWNVCQVGHHANVASWNFDPTAAFDLSSGQYFFRANDVDLVPVWIDAVPSGGQDLAENPAKTGGANVAVNEKFAGGQIMAQFAGDDTDMTWFDNDVVDKRGLPPNRAIEMPARAAHLVEDADLSFGCPFAGWRVFDLAEHRSEQRTLVLQLQAFAFRNVNAINGPVKADPGDRGRDKQNDDSSYPFHILFSLFQVHYFLMKAGGGRRCLLLIGWRIHICRFVA